MLAASAGTSSDGTGELLVPPSGRIHMAPGWIPPRALMAPAHNLSSASGAVNAAAIWGAPGMTLPRPVRPPPDGHIAVRATSWLPVPVDQVPRWSCQSSLGPGRALEAEIVLSYDVPF